MGLATRLRTTAVVGTAAMRCRRILDRPQQADQCSQQRRSQAHPHGKCLLIDTMLCEIPGGVVATERKDERGRMNQNHSRFILHPSSFIASEATDSFSAYGYRLAILPGIRGCDSLRSLPRLRCFRLQRPWRLCRRVRMCGPPSASRSASAGKSIQAWASARLFPSKTQAKEGREDFLQRNEEVGLHRNDLLRWVRLFVR